MHVFFNVMVRHKEYFEKKDVIRESYNFIYEVIKYLYANKGIIIL